MKRLKKVFKAAVGVLCAVSVLCLTCINAFASAGVLAGGAVITLLAYLLVSSGAATQSQVNTMSNSGIIEMAQTNVEILPSAFPTAPDSLVNNAFIEAAADSAFITATGFSVLDFVIDHQFDVSVSPGDLVDLQGRGAGFVTYNEKGSGVRYFCDYIEIVSNGSSVSKVILHGDVNIDFYRDGKFSSQSTGKDVTFVPGSRGLGIIIHGINDGYSGTLTGDVRWTGDVIESVNDNISDNVASVPDAIGTVDIGGETYDVNADGTVTVGDTTYTINNDGSVTVNEGDDIKNYCPTYNFDVYEDSAIQDLIQDLIDTAENERYDDIEVPAVGIDVLDNMVLPKTISTVFPFCLPFDFVRGMKLFSAKPEVPHFEVEINVPAFLNIPAQTWKFVIDLEQFETLAIISRWLSLLSFSYLLISLSVTIVKGVR